MPLVCMPLVCYGHFPSPHVSHQYPQRCGWYPFTFFVDAAGSVIVCCGKYFVERRGGKRAVLLISNH